jgi:regulator of protease activity HflC (stomatin/prohibitin superfamily)
LKEIDPPEDVQETMNKMVKAENEKVAAVDFATATETMVVPSNTELVNVFGELAGIMPLNRGATTTKTL